MARLVMSVIIHAASTFSAQPAFLNILAQQRIRTIFFAERLMQIFQDLQPDIEPHEIDHLERAHWMIQSQLDGFIDIRGRSDSGFEHGEGFIANQCVDARSDEAGRFIYDDGFLVHAMRDGRANRHGIV